MQHFGMIQLGKHILTLIMTMTVCFGWSQTDYSFIDKYGDTLIISNINKQTPELDTTFFKSNLSGSYFDTAVALNENRYTFIVSDIERTKKENEFEFSLRIIPGSKHIEDILKHLGGPSHYRMTIKKVNGIYEIDKIEFLYGEI